MKPLSIALPYDYDKDTDLERVLRPFKRHPLVENILLLSTERDLIRTSTVQLIRVDSFFSGKLLECLLEQWKSDYLLLVFPGECIEWSARALERLLQIMEDSGAGLVYSDFREVKGDEITDHPLIDYQLGSIRDSFNFGSAIVLARRAVNRALSRWGEVPHDLKWGGLYDLRLKLSVNERIVRLPEMIYSRVERDMRASGERIFDYVDPAQRTYQSEMERIATAHLKRVGAYLEPKFKAIPVVDASFPVKASIVIPVRNRRETIGDAVRSALAQQTDFSYNLIVVDNRSTDGTTPVLAQLASSDERVVHLIPERKDLGIGGCWNEAIYSPVCGQYAVQLDSDDLYADERTLARMIRVFERNEYAMVIGSYTTVDFELHHVLPGLVDHREWTRENGHNNALRINGLGAPRAFAVAVLRQIGFPNVSYGEDYAVALRIGREYEIGRIYDSIYLARRWGGNSDSALPLPIMNRYDAYKDWIRTQEILARSKS